MSIAEALTNVVLTPIEGGLKGISLSANWMWPCKNAGEDARLYRAVQAASDFAKALQINIPTGKDSLSMTQKYKDGDSVYSPGTVIISTVGEVQDIRKTVTPFVKPDEDAVLVYVDFGKSGQKLGGSALAQVVNGLGTETPTVTDPAYFAKAFNAVQKLVAEGKVLAGHDVSAGGLITCLLEMNFANAKAVWQFVWIISTTTTMLKCSSTKTLPLFYKLPLKLLKNYKLRAFHASHLVVIVVTTEIFLRLG